MSGALVAGIVLSPGLLDLVGHLQRTTALVNADRAGIQTLAGIGVVLLLFLAGLETDIDEFVRAGRGAALVAVGGVLATVGLVLGAAELGGLSLRESFFVGVMLASTSVSISVQAMLDLRLLQSRVGLTILGAAVIDDVIGLILFSAALAALGISGISPVVLIAGLAAYVGLSLGLGLRYAAPVIDAVQRLRTTESLLGISIAFCVLMGWLAQTAGIAAISGAYLGGLIMARSAGVELIARVRIVAYALPVPIFLVNVGMQADLRNLSGGAFLLVIVAVATIVAKIAGCGAGAVIEGLRGRRAAMVGFGMIPRGEVTLVIAALGVQNHVLSQTGYALGVLAVLVSAVVTPPLLKLIAGGHGAAAAGRGVAAQPAA